MSKELFAEIRAAIEAGELRVLATVAATRGSTPRKAGAHMLLRPDGTFSGTVGGGCGEAEVWQGAMETMADGRPRLVQVDLTEPVDGDDKICGGVMDVFIERVSG
ncbi:MAG: XdhC family protein [Dehalococcoidia bacterium]|nr:XdhC family protein [Dehalococcoidia bacterium]